ncbi:MAG: FkbM family methyltransferase [Thermoleophilia bacterium]|nr:FkbM family methyltransferase [Gaiellaceae bacterium]MDW8338565.1 FkbM family methyltransferase [Thermoleophilia bacterium]
MAPCPFTLGARAWRFLRSDDFRRAPVRAVSRRLAWRARWRLRPGEPIVLDPWALGLRIALPRTGTAALVYYNGFSDPLLANEIIDRLAPGTTYVEVGAHIGEYVLCAAATVGPRGRVFAFEPNPALAGAVEENVRLNGLENVTVLPLAVSARSGRSGFHHNDRSGGGWLVQGPDAPLRVETTSLDDFARRFRIRTIDLVKIDAAGAETDVLAGARELATSGRLPLVIAKLYNPAVARERFGVESLDLVELLLRWGYRLKALSGTGRVPIHNVSDISPVLASAYTVVVVGTRSPSSL